EGASSDRQSRTAQRIQYCEAGVGVRTDDRRPRCGGKLEKRMNDALQDSDLRPSWRRLPSSPTKRSASSARQRTGRSRYSLSDADRARSVASSRTRDMDIGRVRACPLMVAATAAVLFVALATLFIHVCADGGAMASAYRTCSCKGLEWQIYD